MCLMEDMQNVFVVHDLVEGNYYLEVEGILVDMRVWLEVSRCFEG